MGSTYSWGTVMLSSCQVMGLPAEMCMSIQESLGD
jgi:hypothetical protein